MTDEDMMQSSLSEEDGVYRQDLYNTFKDITGYDYDKITRRVKKSKKDNDMQTVCSYMAQRIINFIHPALTNFTKYTNNSNDIVGLKSIHNIEGLGALWRNNFVHDCDLKPKATGWCMRRIKEDEWWNRYANNLWRFVDDSYRHSISGFTRREKNKMTKVDEQRSVVVNTGKPKKNWAENLGLTKPKKEEQEDEYET